MFRRLSLSGLVMVVMLGSQLLSEGRAAAQQPTADQIKAALTPKPVTRSLVTRQIAVEDKAPSINLRVSFGYDSAEILPEAVTLLDALVTALKDPRFATTKFEIGGYTDAKGSDDYNMALSARRADAVRHYLIEKGQLPAELLSAVGYGKTKLADPDHPEDGVNRRVEIVNLSAVSASK